MRKKKVYMNVWNSSPISRNKNVLNSYQNNSTNIHYKNELNWLKINWKQFYEIMIPVRTIFLINTNKIITNSKFDPDKSQFQIGQFTLFLYHYFKKPPDLRLYIIVTISSFQTHLVWPFYLHLLTSTEFLFSNSDFHDPWHFSLMEVTPTLFLNKTTSKTPTEPSR